MCGILGCVTEDGITRKDITSILELINLNSKRGPLAYGIVSDEYLIKATVNPSEIDFELLEKFIGQKYILIHLRAPTGDAKNDLEFTQPFIGDDSKLLFNGILTEWNDDLFKNDTYEVFDRLSLEGLDGLSKLHGSFAICWVKKNEIFLARCINSLFYNNHFFSSEKFNNAVELRHGEILNFKTREVETFEAYTPYDIKE